MLAFDFGEKRVGVAVGDLNFSLAHPLVTIRSENSERRFADIAALIEGWKPVLLVVGLPLYMDGEEHEVSRLARRFARRLEGRYGLTTVLVDERLTSIDARSGLREAGVAGRKQKLLVDQVAAQKILQSYFDSRTRSAR